MQSVAIVAQPHQTRSYTVDKKLLHGEAYGLAAVYAMGWKKELGQSLARVRYAGGYIYPGGREQYCCRRTVCRRHAL